MSPFPQVFWQVKEWIMLKLLKMIRMSHAIALPSGFLDVMGEIAREKCS